jgi:hypothetical protein
MTTFDYTSRDYYGIREDLLSRAATLPIGADWDTRSPADFGVMLVELWAYMGDILHFYVDRAAAEAYLRTATQRESVLALANLLDYSPLSLNSAQATITLGKTTGFVDGTVIAAGTSFIAPSRNNTENTVYFVSDEAITMTASAPTFVVSVSEGTLVTSEQIINSIVASGNTSNGLPSQRFILRNTSIVPSSVSINVYEGPVVSGAPTPVEYLYVERLGDYTASDRVFTIEVAADGVVQVIFGNGTNGKIPSTNAAITADYLKSSGSSGNIPQERITSFSNNTPTGVVIVGSSASTGGFDEESITSLKANVPLLFRTQDRAVSLQDFKDLILRIPGVVKGTASNSGSNVTLYPIPYQDDYLNIAFGSSITIDATTAADTLTYFAPRTMVGASVGIAPSINLVDVHVQATVYIKEGYVQRWVINAVEEAFNEFLDFDAVSFNQTLSVGQFYRAATAIDGVDYIYISVFNTTSSGLAANHRITSGPTSLLHKAADFILVPNGGITG